MLKKLVSWLLRQKEPVLPDLYWAEEFLPNSGCLEGDNARILVKYKYGEPASMVAYHPALAEALMKSGYAFVDLTNQANTGPGCIPKRHVIMDLVTDRLKREIRMWNLGKHQRRYGL